MRHYIFSKTFIICALFFLAAFSSVSQEKIGISNSNYSSINSIHLNPSSSVDSRTFVQVNIVGLHLYAINNTAYLPKFSVWSANNSIQPGINTSSQKKFLYLKSDVSVPGFVISNRKIGFGIFARARVEADFKKIPYELTQIISKQQIDTLQPAHEINIKNAKISAMAWTEYGVNFGSVISRRNSVMMTLGGNLKYLTGIGLAYSNLKEFNAQIDKNQINATLDGRVRYSIPKWNSGKGVGADIGFTYKKMISSIDNYFSNSKLSNCTYIDYQYKIGVSILDAGFIRYNVGTYKGDVSGETETDDYKNTNMDSLVRADFSVSQQTNKPVYASTPTGVSIQTDWNLGYYMRNNIFKHVYVNATIVQSVLTKKVTGVQRSNTLSLTPRYERKNIEVALPVTLYNYQKLQLGLAFRFRTFVLGVDNIMPVIKKSNTYGVSVYTNLGISLFKNPACRKKKRFPKLKKMLGYFPTIFHVNRKGKDNHKLDSKERGDNKQVDDCPELEAPKKKKE